LTPFEVRWKGKPLEDVLDEAGTRGGMRYSFRCLVCDLAASMNKSEKQFYREYDLEERNQLVASYRSQLDRRTAMVVSPVTPQG